jgi:hypothetical protein
MGDRRNRSAERARRGRSTGPLEPSPPRARRCEGMRQHGHTRWRRMALAVLGTAWLAGCTAGGGGPEVALPPETPRVAGVERPVDRDHARLVEAFGGEVQAPAAQALLTDITARLVAVSERPDEAYRVTILNSPGSQCLRPPVGPHLRDARAPGPGQRHGGDRRRALARNRPCDATPCRRPHGARSALEPAHASDREGAEPSG